jgi:hypothetical protein
VITLQFVGSSALSSRLIELKGGGPYSHVDIVLKDGTLLGARSDAVGGQPPGVRIRPPDYESWEHIARISIDSLPYQEANAYAFAQAQLGKPYDTTAIIGFIFNRGWREDDSWICSELAIAMVEQAGIYNYPPAVPSNKIDPCMAFALASTIGVVTHY